jgi:hypothetical protein
MGFIGMFDNAVTDVRGRHGAQREARRFADSVVPGCTYYAVLDCNFAWGRGRALLEIVFSKRDWATGQPMWGHLTAGGVWLSYGPILTNRPADRRLKTFAEMAGAPQFPPDPEQAMRALRQLGATPVGV